MLSAKQSNRNTESGYAQLHAFRQTREPSADFFCIFCLMTSKRLRMTKKRVSCLALLDAMTTAIQKCVQLLLGVPTANLSERSLRRDLL
jgi:hypothetical protein